MPESSGLVFDVTVAAIASDLRAEPREAVLAIVVRRSLRGVLHPRRPPLQHGSAAHKKQQQRFLYAELLRVVAQQLLVHDIGGHVDVRLSVPAFHDSSARREPCAAPCPFAS